MKLLVSNMVVRFPLAILLLAACSHESRADPVFRLEGDRQIVVDGLQLNIDDRGKDVSLYVYVGESTTPVLGKTTVTANSVVFEPRFALQPGVEYRTVLKLAPVSGASVATTSSRFEGAVRLPAVVSEHSEVQLQIFPSSAELPENLLKFYLNFSQPMQRGRSYDFIQLLDHDGKEVELPFLEIGEELWDTQQVRLTLLLDPGRIKRGLKPNEQVGLPLRQDFSYTLVIQPDWPSAAGATLRSEYRKQFTVHSSDLRKPNPLDWRIEAPQSNTCAPLIVHFDEPLDRAMLEHSLSIHSPEGSELAGTVEVFAQETGWSFTPSAEWFPGTYELVVSPILEDLAGNSVGREFEVDLTQASESASTDEAVRMPITIE